MANHTYHLFHVTEGIDLGFFVNPGYVFSHRSFALRHKHILLVNVLQLTIIL